MYRDYCFRIQSWRLGVRDLISCDYSNYYSFVSICYRSKEMGGSYSMCINDPFREDAKISALGMLVSLLHTSLVVFVLFLFIYFKCYRNINFIHHSTHANIVAFHSALNFRQNIFMIMTVAAVVTNAGLAVFTMQGLDYLDTTTRL